MPNLLLWARGSSPHTRGAPAVRAASWRRIRIIPAYAGSTLRSGRASSSIADHPRIRGEHDFLELHPVERIRIIPAYAGSTRVMDCPA